MAIISGHSGGGYTNNMAMQTRPYCDKDCLLAAQTETVEALVAAPQAVAGLPASPPGIPAGSEASSWLPLSTATTVSSVVLVEFD